MDCPYCHRPYPEPGFPNSHGRIPVAGCDLIAEGQRAVSHGHGLSAGRLRAWLGILDDVEALQDMLRAAVDRRAARAWEAAGVDPRDVGLESTANGGR